MRYLLMLLVLFSCIAMGRERGPVSDTAYQTVLSLGIASSAVSLFSVAVYAYNQGRYENDLDNYNRHTMEGNPDWNGALWEFGDLWLEVERSKKSAQFTGSVMVYSLAAGAVLMTTALFMKIRNNRVAFAPVIDLDNKSAGLALTSSF